MDLNLNDNKFLRCDINDSTADISCMSLITKTGVFRNDFDICKIKPEKLLLNDIDIRNGIYYQVGTDPYFCFTSGYFTEKIEWIVLLRQNMYLFVTVSILLMVLFTGFILKSKR